MVNHKNRETMETRLTEKGKKLFPDGPKIWKERAFVAAGMNINEAFELGLFESVPERIILSAERLPGKWHALNYQKLEKAELVKFTKSEIKIMEHAINKEYGKIPGNLEWVYELHYDYKENGENYDNFDHYLDRIKANK